LTLKSVIIFITSVWCISVHLCRLTHTCTCYQRSVGCY